MPLSPETRALLEAHARADTELAERLVGEGEKDLAIELFRRGVFLTEWLKGKAALTRSTVTDKLRGDMEAAHREKLSKAQTGKKRHPALDVAKKHGMHSIADIAQQLGYSKAMMSRILSGDRRMGPDEAAKWKKLTGEDWRS